MKVEDQAGAKVEVRDTPEAKLESNIDNTTVIDYVNKAAPGPMVEIDPVTVFRRIIAERCASLATARAKLKAGDTVAIQSTAPAPFLLGRKGLGKSMLAIAVVLVFLALAYFLRSRTDGEKQTELTSTKGKENLDESTDNGRRKLVKDTIKAPESVLTAMAIGAASVGRPKVHTGSTHDTPHVEHGNMVETQKPEGVAEAKPIVNTSETTALENMKSEGHGIPTFNQVPYVPSKMEGFGFFKSQSIGADVTEGPWFAQAADDAGNSHLESSMQLTSVVEEVGYKDVLAQRQELHVSTETVVEKFVSEIPVSDVRYETLPMSNVVDGEFSGEVVSVSVVTEEAVEENNKGAQVESFKFKEQPNDDKLLADNSAIVEKLEQMIGQESIATMEEKNVVGKIDAIDASEENVLIDLPTLDLSNDGTNVADMDIDMSNTNSDTDESDAQSEVQQSLTPLPAPVEKIPLSAPVDKVALPAPVEKVPLPAPVEKVALLEASASGAGDGQGTDSLDVGKRLNDGTNLLAMDTEMNNTDSDSYDGENDAQLEVKQSLTPLPAPVEKAALLGASASEADHEGQGTDSLHVKDDGDAIGLLSGVDQTLEKIEAELDDVLDDVSLSGDDTQTGIVGEEVSIEPNRLGGGVTTQTTIEPLIATQMTEEPQMDASVHLNQITHQDLGAMAYGSSVNAFLQSLEEDPREDNKKALEAALPALAIGVGTVGTLFGVAGGLQVVGFAALASFVSQDVFWAQSREELWQEVKGITDRQKLSDFLARRNIVRKDQEEEEESSRL